MSYIYLIASVLVGSLLVVFLKPNNKKVRLLLAFSGAYLLSVTVLHLLPEVYNPTSQDNLVGIFILLGIVVQSILESFSKGAEHGHIHVHRKSDKFPMLLFLSLCIHAFSEGLPINFTDNNLLWGIVVHKVPIAVVLTTFLLHTNYSRKTIFLFLFVFALMSPLGVYFGESFSFFQIHSTKITAFIVGVFLHISTIILFESTENHKFNVKKFGVILLGFLLSYLSL